MLTVVTAIRSVGRVIQLRTYHGAVSDELSLFGDDEPAQPEAVQSVPAPIADWQVDMLRKALDARDLTAMAERQEVIEEAVGRSVESLRALTHEEGLRVLSQLGQAPTTQTSSKSAWDDRDEDTWIDRL